jgi:hypothetical protein
MMLYGFCRECPFSCDEENLLVVSLRSSVQALTPTNAASIGSFEAARRMPFCRRCRADVAQRRQFGLPAMQFEILGILVPID